MKKKQVSVRTLQRELKRVSEVLAMTKDALEMTADVQVSTEKALAAVRAELVLAEAGNDGLRLVIREKVVNNGSLKLENMRLAGDLQRSEEDQIFLREQLQQARNDRQGYHALAVILGAKALADTTPMEFAGVLKGACVVEGYDEAAVTKAAEEVLPEATRRAFSAKMKALNAPSEQDQQLAALAEDAEGGRPLSPLALTLAEVLQGGPGKPCKSCGEVHI